MTDKEIKSRIIELRDILSKEKSELKPLIPVLPEPLDDRAKTSMSPWWRGNNQCIPGVSRKGESVFDINKSK
jgi:hypothetical protein